MATLIPAGWVRTGHGIPGVCSRHGQPATRRRRVVIESRPPGWTYATIPAGLLIFAILRAVFRKALVAPAWPFCDRCRRRRMVAMALAGATVALGLVTIVVGVQSPDSDVAAGLFGVGLLIALLGYIGFLWATPAATARARLTRDGLYVAVKHANPAFVAQLVGEPTPHRPGSYPSTVG